MTFDLGQAVLLIFVYLLVLFGIAYITDRGWIPRKVVQHPATYVLSLGICISAWGFYGVIDLAYQFGYGALAYYLGTGAMFLFAPVALQPLVKLAQQFKIPSLADLLVFRYHNHTVGVLATLCMLLAVIPLMVLQMEAMADSLQILTRHSSAVYDLENSFISFNRVAALGYCIALVLFTILFGSKHEQHMGLITAMAFESLIKVCAICAIGLLSVYGVFNGFDGLDNWLVDHPENLDMLHSPIRDSSSHTLLLVFIATALTMPHIFQMAIVENPKRSNSIVTWAFPLFLLLMALPVFPILWAGLELALPLSPQYFTLGIPLFMDSPGFTLLAFLGGMSAATGALVVITLALTTMVLNHWILPFFRLDASRNVHSQLIWLKRFVILGVFAIAYTFYLLLQANHSLSDLALIAFIETLQFVPAIFAITYWPRGNYRGVLAGLIVGTSIWLIGLMIPIITKITVLPIFGEEIPIGQQHWNAISLIAIGCNCLAFILVSTFTQQSDEESYSAAICADDELSQPLRVTLDAHTADEFKERLGQALGQQLAATEVNRALEELGFPSNERRPYALRRLRSKLEINLSGLMGTSVAGEILDLYIPLKVPDAKGSTDINLMETRLTQYRDHLTGMAAELNNLRLYHRNTLYSLPMAVCSIGQDLEILMWNEAMADLTKIPSEDVTGSLLTDLPAPWDSVLASFSNGAQAHLYKQPIDLDSKEHWISLHKASLSSPIIESNIGQVILLEDVTELQLLEKELIHSERLASVGRLAAGVAHEIGNPITGIACLAQNLQYEESPDAAQETAHLILSQTDRVSRIVQSLMSFSHGGRHTQTELKPLYIRDCAEQAIQLLALQKEKTQVNYHNRVPADVKILGDVQQLIQVFVNLLSNARDASDEDSNIWIDGRSEPGVVTVDVTDEGSGIAPEHLEQIVEPFFTTKDPGEGTGLGLAMVYSIINEHKGELQVHSPVDKATHTGTRFSLTFPG